VPLVQIPRLMAFSRSACGRRSIHLHQLGRPRRSATLPRAIRCLACMSRMSTKSFAFAIRSAWRPLQSPPRAGAFVMHFPLACPSYVARATHGGWPWLHAEAAIQPSSSLAAFSPARHRILGKSDVMCPMLHSASLCPLPRF
jgi:hypothetical protein